MERPEPSIQQLAACRSALRAAHERLLTVLRTGGDHLPPVGELVWWAVIVDGLLERRSSAYAPERDGRCPIVLGLRHARNLVAHGVNPAGVTRPAGFTFPITLPFSSPSARWAPFRELPLLERRSKRNEGAYQNHLAEQPLSRTTTEALDFLLDACGRAGG